VRVQVPPTAPKTFILKSRRFHPAALFLFMAYFLMHNILILW
jgi:hypothetical protein